jgi:hypothetical protein
VSSKYASQTTKSTNLKVVPAAKLAAGLRLAGLAPSEGMGPGEFRAACESASIQELGKNIRVAFHWRIVDGPHAGTALRGWITISKDGSVIIAPKSRYAMACEVALGRSLDVTDDVNNPNAIFGGGQIFRVFVGYRKTEHPRGGKASDDFAYVCKGRDDSLRVHEIQAREEL